jgi:hypothetical protein
MKSCLSVYIFHSLWITFGLGDVHKFLLIDSKFRKNLCTGIHNNCGCTFHIYCPVWVSIGIRKLHMFLLRVCEFHENRRREGLTFRRGLNEIAFTHAP